MVDELWVLVLGGQARLAERGVEAVGRVPGGRGQHLQPERELGGGRRLVGIKDREPGRSRRLLDPHRRGGRRPPDPGPSWSPATLAQEILEDPPRPVLYLS